MLSRNNIEVLRYLGKRFLKPYWKQILIFASLNAAMGMLFSLRPIMLTPALDFFVDTATAPAASILDINLSNIGATIRAWFGIGIDDYVGIGILVAVLYTSVSALVSILNYVSYWGNQKLRALVRRDMTVAVYRHMIHLPLSFFHRFKAGQLVNRLTFDVVRTASGLDEIPREVIRATFRLAVIGFILVASNPWLALLIIFVGALHFWVTRWLTTRVKSTTRALGEQMAESQAGYQESVSAARLIKSFAAERYDVRRIYDITEQVRSADVKAAVVRYSEVPIRLVLDAALAGIILMLALIAVGHEMLTIQAALMYFYLAQQSIEPVSILGKQMLSIQQLLASANPLMELFNERNELVDGPKYPTPLNEVIELKGVQYAYPGNPDVLRGIDLQIRSGEMVALVGPSGAGKSTLADLILRFYDPTSGSILFDDIDIREFKQREYRRQFGVVSQDTLLFNASLRDNIVFDKKYSESDLQHAIDVANAAEFIRDLPQGLDTMIGDRGLRLSGGQRQRIAIARAIYHRPQILILDEATSALDSESERLVQEALDRLAKEVTLIVIAHRLGTIQHADKIVVLKSGNIEAIGTHAELLDTSPTYQKLSNLQQSMS